MISDALVASAEVSTGRERADYPPTCTKVGSRAETEAAAFWAGAHARLARYARALGSSEQDALDIAQEAHTRALERDLPYSDHEDLLRWCQVVGRRLVVDEHRRRQRLVTGVSCPEPVAASDPSEIAHQRDLLRRVAQQIVELPAAQRHAIVSLLAGAEPTPGNRKAQARLAVARNKARRSLRLATGYGAIVLAPVVVLMRKLARPTVLASGASAVLVASLLGTASGQGRHALVPTQPESTLRPAATAYLTAGFQDSQHRN
ncbi:MAG: RNA polymerase sigma factor [Mycobacteriales bacterium]